MKNNIFVSGVGRSGTSALGKRFDEAQNADGESYRTLCARIAAAKG